MSEEFAMQPEEFDSTNERLDSILDRLNALGQSASAMKVAPLAGAAAPAVDAEPDASGAITFDEFVAPEIPDEVAPDLDQVLEEAPAAIEPPVIEAPAIESAVIEPPVIEPPVIEAPAIESAVIEPPTIEPQAVEPTVPQSTVFDIETEEAKEAAEEAEIDEAVAVVQPAESTISATEPNEPAITETAETEQGAVGELDDVDFDTPVDGEVFAALETVELSDPIESVSAETDAVEAAQPVETVATEAVEAPEHVEAVEAAFEPIEPAEMVETQRAASPPPVPTEDPDSQVFELDGPFEVGSAPGIQPDAPTSIFGSSLNQPETAVVSTPETPEIASEPATDGWVSYHEPVAPQAEPAAADVPESNTFGATVETTSGYDVNNDPQWDLAAPLEGSIFDQAPNNTSAAPSNPVDVATEVEQTLGELDSFSTFDSAEEPVQLAGLDMSAESVDLSAFDATGNEEVGLFDTDDELPLPDFTGVYDESQTGSAGKGVESGVKGISVGREELDKLRPSDEESQNAETAAQESGNLRLNKQFLLVLIFGIAVLVFFLITQPDAVEDMQRSIDSLLGRS